MNFQNELPDIHVIVISKQYNFYTISVELP